MNLKQRCKCGHQKDVHGDDFKGDDYGGECCIIYRKDGNLKSCPCTAFSNSDRESGPPKSVTGTTSQQAQDNQKDCQAVNQKNRSPAETQKSDKMQGDKK